VTGEGFEKAPIAKSGEAGRSEKEKAAGGKASKLS